MTVFYTRSQNCEKQLYASNVCLSVRPSACMVQLGSRKNDIHEILDSGIFFGNLLAELKFH